MLRFIKSEVCSKTKFVNLLMPNNKLFKNFSSTINNKHSLQDNVISSLLHTIKKNY
jgi:hypothetical protein